MSQIKNCIRSLIFAWCFALATSAVWGQTEVKPGFNLFSEEQDIEIGQNSAEEVERELPVLDDSLVQDYIERVGARLAQVVQGPDFPYQFKVINVSDINAFALPGGFMYVNRGLVEAASTEAELAGVMAHEIAHVALRHGTNQASKAYLAQAGLGVLGGVLGGRGTGDMIGAIGGFGLNTVFLKFSRGAEEQADVVGAQTLARAGYDPLAMADFFDLLQEQAGGDPGKFEQFFSSHPAPGNRARRIEEEVRLLEPISITRGVGGFSRIRARLMSIPAAPSMSELAGESPSSTPTPDERPAERRPNWEDIEAPSERLTLFEQRDRFFRLRYPSNWQVREADRDWGVTLAPEGGVLAGDRGQSQIVYGILLSHFDPYDASARDRFSRDQGPFPGSDDLERAGNLLISMLVEGNNYLRPISRSTAEYIVDGQRSLGVELSGRSPATGQAERAAVVYRRLPNDELVYLVLVVPERRQSEMQRLQDRLLSSLSINDEAFVRR